MLQSVRCYKWMHSPHILHMCCTLHLCPVPTTCWCYNALQQKIEAELHFHIFTQFQTFKFSRKYTFTLHIFTNTHRHHTVSMYIHDHAVSILREKMHTESQMVKRMMPSCVLSKTAIFSQSTCGGFTQIGGTFRQNVWESSFKMSKLSIFFKKLDLLCI